MNTAVNKPVRIADALRAKVIGILTEPPQLENKKKPSNVALNVAWFAFNFLLFVLDFGTAVTVSMLTNVFYGLLTFLAGFAPTLLYEFMYTRAFASKYQRIIAVVGALIGATSTLLIGVLAGVVNVLRMLEILAITTSAILWIEIGMIVGLVCFAGLHVALLAGYFYIDEGIKRVHARSQSLANVEMKIDSVKDARMLAKAGLDAAKEVDEADDENLGEAVRMIYKKLTGNDLLNNGDAPILADSSMPIVAQDKRLYQAEVGNAPSFPDERQG